MVEFNLRGVVTNQGAGRKLNLFHIKLNTWNVKHLWLVPDMKLAAPTTDGSTQLFYVNNVKCCLLGTY